MAGEQIKNHLIIGLGGTGGNVIRELRRSMKLNESTTKQDVNYKYHYFDTSNDVLVSEKNPWTVNGSNISLDQSEYLIAQTGSIRQIINQKESYPGIAPWIEPVNAFSFVNDDTKGAAQRRKLGRLVFAQNANVFMTQVASKVSTLEKMGRTGVTIHIVCGLGGGTGSGAIVDVIALIRNQYPNVATHQIIVYAVLPDLNNTERTKSVAGYGLYYANGYAALLELNAMQVGKYHPHNLLATNGNLAPGSRPKTYFNCCYLIDKVNDHGFHFDIDTEIPRQVSEFLYQKTQNAGWARLNSYEGQENITTFAETELNEPTRSRLFMGFGINRIFVPEDEIKQFMAMNYSDNIVKQFVWNNFSDGIGYIDREVERDWRSELFSEGYLNKYMISDEYLLYEFGILENDQQKKNGNKRIGDFWAGVAKAAHQHVTDNKSLPKQTWPSEAYKIFNKVYESGYRKGNDQGSAIGVNEFYTRKSNATGNVGKHIARLISEDLFKQWREGEISLKYAEKLVEEILAYLDDKQTQYNRRSQTAKNTEEDLQVATNNARTAYNNLGILTFDSTRRNTLEHYCNSLSNLYVQKTNARAYLFASSSLIPAVKKEINNILLHINEVTAKMLDVENFLSSNAITLRNLGNSFNSEGDAEYNFEKGQIKIVQEDNIAAMYKAIIDQNELKHKSNAQEVREKIVLSRGLETNSFGQLKDISSTELRNIINREVNDQIKTTHELLRTEFKPVIDINIIERLKERYEDVDLRTEFIKKVINQAGTLLQIDQNEVLMVPPENQEAGTTTIQKITGIFIPEVDAELTDFRSDIIQSFKAQADNSANVEAIDTRLSNQLLLIRVFSTMPARFLTCVKELKKHYVGVSLNKVEQSLIHGTFDIENIPDIFLPCPEERKVLAEKQKARELQDFVINLAMAMFAEKLTFDTENSQWKLEYTKDQIKRTDIVSRDAGFKNLMHVEQTDHLKGQCKEAAEAYIHSTRKDTVFSKYIDFVNEALPNEFNNDATDPDYNLLADSVETLKAKLENMVKV